MEMWGDAVVGVPVGAGDTRSELKELAHWALVRPVYAMLAMLRDIVDVGVGVR